MGVSSAIDDAYVIRQACSVVHYDFGKCPSIKHLLCMVLLLIWEVMAARCSYAQSASAAINGTITDQSGAQISDAQIVLHNVGTGVQRITTSGSAGTYSITGVVPGTIPCKP